MPTLLLQDDFNVTAADVDRSKWTTPVGNDAFFGRTAIRTPASTSDGSGLIPVSGGVAHLKLSTFNPTARSAGDSFWGSEIDTLASFALGGSVAGLQFEASVRSPVEKPPGIVTSVFGFAKTTSNLHDELDWDFLSNWYRPGVAPPHALINHYGNEPLGAGHGADVAFASGFDFSAF